MNKETALSFIRAARSGDCEAAVRLVTPAAAHHNPYFPAGMPVLVDAIAAAAKEQPDGTFEPKHVIEDGDLVAVHSHVQHKPGEPGIAVVHLFRFEGGLIAELWDVVQMVPADNVNRDGMF